MARMKLIGLRVISCLLALVMVGPGLQKFTSPVWQRMFRNWGYPEHFYLVIGAIQVIAGLGLLIPKTAAPSAALLSIVMIGAAITQIAAGGRNGVVEFVIAALLALVAYARREPWLQRYRQGEVRKTVAAG